MGEYAAKFSSNRLRAVAVPVLLVVIVAFSAYLRFYRLSEQGILGVDEGRYVLDALSARAELGVYTGIVRGKLTENGGGAEFRLHDFLAQAHADLAKQHPFAPKPGFACASAAAMMVTDNVIGACSRVEAFCGILTVIVLFGFVRDLCGARAALIASALLAVSVYHIYFSRNAYPQCSAGVLLLLAFWCHYRWFRARDSLEESMPRLWLVLCGVLVGLSFWFNYQIAGALPAIGFVHLFTSMQLRPNKRAARALVGGAIALAVGFIGVMVLAEAWTYPIILLFRGYGLAYPHATFLELLAPRLIGQSSVAWNGSGWPLLAYFIIATEGAFYLAAIALPIVAVAGQIAFRAARTPGTGALALIHPAIVYCAVPLVAIWAVFSFKTMQGARTFSTALPFLLAGTAIAVDTALRGTARLPRYALLPSAVCAFVSLFLYFPGRMNEVLTIRSAYPDVIEFARTQTPPAACAAWSAVLEAYGAAYDVETSSVYAGDAASSSAVFVSDWQELYNRRTPDTPIGLVPGAVPIKTFSHEFGRMFLTIEAFPSFGNTWDNIAWTRALDAGMYRTVFVYRASDVQRPATASIASP